LAFAGTTLAGALAAAEAVPPAQAPAVPELGASVLRVLGALVFVLGLFFVGLWLARNGQRFAWRRGRSPRLNVFEARSLGGRQTLYVVGYQEQRFLIGAAPHGLTLIATLPSDPGTVADTVAPPFAETLRAVLQRSP
jgi:flagellar biogenesis protein FliO